MFKINDVDVDVSFKCNEELCEALQHELYALKNQIGETRLVSDAVRLCHKLIAVDYALNEITEESIDQLDSLIDQPATVEVKANPDGILRTPMSDEVLLDILTKGKGYHPLTRLKFEDDKTVQTELGLFTVKICLGTKCIERKVWLVPTTND